MGGKRFLIIGRGVFGIDLFLSFFFSFFLFFRYFYSAYTLVFPYTRFNGDSPRVLL